MGICSHFKTYWNGFNCLSVEFRLAARRSENYLAYSVVSDHRKSLTEPLLALVPELIQLMSMAMGNISQDFDFQSVTEPKKDIKLLYLKVGR